MVGGFIRELREAKGLTQDAFGLSIGLSRDSVAALERGTKVVTLPIAAAIRRVYEVDINKWCDELHLPLIDLPSLATVRIARSLGVRIEDVEAAAISLWGKSVVEYMAELDSFALKGHATRQLKAEIRRYK